MKLIMILLVNLFAITLTSALVQSNNEQEKLFFLQNSSGKDNETLLVVTWTEIEDERSPGCEIFSDKDLINQVLDSSSDSPIRKLSENEMQILLEECTQIELRRRKREDSTRTTISLDYIDDYPEELARRRSGGRRRSRNRVTNNKNSGGKPRSNNTGATTAQDKRPSNRTTDVRGTPKNPKLNDTLETTTPIFDMCSGSSRRGRNSEIEREDDSSPLSRWKIIYPGTKWCGNGCKAKHYDDLGTHAETDKCCRSHDYCDDIIEAGETKYNLTNDSYFTRLHCSCDEAFYNCLEKANSLAANTIGNLYFNLLNQKCYKKDYPLTDECETHLTLFKVTCKEYRRNLTAPKVYQWFSPKTYVKVLLPG